MKKWMWKIGIAVILLFGMSATCFAMPEQSYVINSEGESQIIPLAYEVSAYYDSFDLAVDTLSSPLDICVDSEDMIYVLDTGHGRVLKLSQDGQVVKEFCPDGAYTLSEAQGMYVDAEGTIYIADTGNGRILIMNQDGEVTGELTQPESSLYDADYPFEPIKVGVDTLGQIYVINNLDYHGFCILDSENEFKGYFAATRLSKDVWGELIEKFASESQLSQMGKTIPAQHTNFYIAEDGSIYTTTANVDTEQMKRYSTVGTNFYAYQGAFGDNESDYIMVLQGKSGAESKFVDVCVDDKGVISLLDNTSGKIYQYDQDGVMLCVFAGSGSWEGRVMNAAAMTQDSEGNIYLLDKDLGSIQIFKPTPFIELVHEASDLYNSGKYEEALSLWEEVLDQASEYSVAHIGVGKALAKQKNYVSAMESYKEAGDKTGYSQVFEKYRSEFVKDYFLWIVVALSVFIVAIIQIVGYLKEKSNYYGMRPMTCNQGKHVATMMIFAPGDACYAIRKSRGKQDVMVPTLILGIALFSHVFRLFLLHYPLAETAVEEVNFFQQVCSFILPFGLWVLGAFYVTCIFQGEIMLKESYIVTCYSLLPYAIFSIPIAVLTNMLEVGSAGFISFLMTVAWMWVILLVVYNMKKMNHFKVKETVGVILCSIVAVLFLAVVAAILYLLGVKIFDFAKEVVREWSLRFM